MRGRRRDTVRRAGHILFCVGLLAAIMSIVVKALDADGPEELQRWGTWADIIAALSGTVATVILVWEKRARRADPPVVDEDRIGRALADLASRIRADWAEEAVRREVTRPAPVLVHWSSTGRPAAARRFVIDDRLGGEWQQLPLRGKTDESNNDIVEAFRSLPHRQLMVLGDPGAGKTVFAMLLTLGLIRRPAAGEPLPVLLSIHAWDTAERLDDFVARRLAEDYGDVLADHGDPLAFARRLVEKQRVLPILDGLDELPADGIAQAMDRLDLFAAAGRPLVVTCRSDEYEQAVARSRVLSRAAVVELASVEVEDAITYLSEPVPDPRWEPVFAHLRTHRDGPLAEAFSTPLMVALARSTYQAVPTADPVDLLEAAETAAGQRSVEARLVAAFVPAVYLPRPRRGTSDQSPAVDVTYHPEQAQRWLMFLARHMSEHGVQDVGWWELNPLIRTGFVAISGGLVALLTALLFVPVFGPAFGLVVAAVAGLGTVAVARGTGGPPQSIHAEEATPRSALSRERARAISRGLRGGALIGVAIGLLLANLLGLRIGYAGLFVVVFGSAYALATMLDHPWGSFFVARLWLGVTGRLPFRLARFLDDAHRRGVLRQSGARHQFRHLILQEHLAGGVSPLSAAPPAATTSQEADGHRPTLHQQRIRLCVAAVGLVFLMMFLLSTAQWAPTYRSGDRPETVKDVGCSASGGSAGCYEYIAGYQWQVGPGGQVSTTFAFPSRQRVIQFRGVAGEFKLPPSNGCANAVFEWQLTTEGRLLRSGGVRATGSRLDPAHAPPHQTRTVAVSVRRTDTEPCTAVLHWDRPGGLYRGVIPGSGPWG
ncbi:NACHT domain-containing protein [Micromonospora sp. NPDC005215]|uniref:NACHT domain-containing protein n=1 Tax=Micromonospora sp. NPDC005215 TaxID=3157024 RepID=UPI0033BD2C82